MLNQVIDNQIYIYWITSTYKFAFTLKKFRKVHDAGLLIAEALMTQQHLFTSVFSNLVFNNLFKIGATLMPCNFLAPLGSLKKKGYYIGYFSTHCY